MTFGEYYTLKNRGTDYYSGSLKEMYQGAIGQLKANESNIKYTGELERYLQERFYPTKETSEKITTMHNNLKSAIEKLYEQEYEKRLKDFEFGQETVHFDSDELIKIIREEHEAWEHKNKISLDVMQQRLNKVKAVQKELDNNPGEHKLNAYKNEMQRLIEIYNKMIARLLATGEDDLHFGSSSKKTGHTITNQSYYDLVNEADSLFKIVSTESGTFSSQDYGNVLEWCLKAYSSDAEYKAEKLEKHLMDEFSKDFIKSFTTTEGTQSADTSISMKLDSLNIVEDEKYEKNFIKTKENDDVFLTIKDPRGGQEFSLKWTKSFSPDTKGRQGKMDVSFKLKTSKNKKVPFRISAKNWATLDRDFGSTSLIFGLLRSGGQFLSTHYSFLMQDENKDNVVTNLLNRAHETAKFACMLDILQGYSQKNTYADTLVINNRKNKKIMVYSIFNIVESIYNNLSGFELGGYNGNEIYGDLKSLSSTIRKMSFDERAGEGNSKLYQELAYKYLQALKVNLKYKNIIEFYGNQAKGQSKSKSKKKSK